MNLLYWLWLIPALPLAGFVILSLAGNALRPHSIAWVGAGSVGLAAVITGLIGWSYFTQEPELSVYRQSFGNWLSVDGFQPQFGLYLDAVACLMLSIITGVGFLIHLYSTEFMQEDEGYRRYFAYLNLFVAAMCILVLADNLLLLYLGWEGVGLCSYLLIGFWYQDANNGYAARKAFVVTRTGDVALLIALFMLFHHFGSLDIPMVLQTAAAQWQAGSTTALVVALLLLGGAVGKSAQLPLQVWLPDAMAGPTPVSALIHAATMVTAGVYLIARMHVMFDLAPIAQTVVAVIGALTLLLAACSALVQRDLKRILAYSTISQIGYMFLALGVGAWTAAMFHLFTHAFFKALLFLGAGVVIQCLHEEHDIFRMGAIRERLPVVFWTFVIGAGSLAALPLVTAGFYSKDLILTEVWTSPRGGLSLWSAGVAGALLTSIYIFRIVFAGFLGPVQENGELSRQPGLRLLVPLAVLATLAVIAGWVETPPAFGGVTVFADALSAALPALPSMSVEPPVLVQAAPALASLIGLLVAWLLFRPQEVEQASHKDRALFQGIESFWYRGWGFDTLYDRIIVTPFCWLARANRQDVIDRLYELIARGNIFVYRRLSQTQTGQLRQYSSVFAAASVLLVAIAVLVA